MKLRNLLLLPLFVGVIFTGCDLLSDSEATGTLRVHLTDEPFPYHLVDEANVTISEVNAINAEDGHFTVTDEERTINLLELQDGVTTLLGEVELPAGRYPQIRLVVEDASVVMNDEEATTYDLTIPSGEQTGIKIVLPNFTIDPDETEELTLDFDVSESFIAQGSTHSTDTIEGFTFKPTIKPLGLQEDDSSTD